MKILNKNFVVFKMLAIGFILAVLMIPSQMISSLVDERQIRRDEATVEVNSKWGDNKYVVGPILVLPYKKIVNATDKKNIVEVVERAYFLPKSLNIDGELKPQILARGIYSIINYNGDLKFDGEYSQPDLEGLGISPASVIWKDAFVFAYIPDPKGLKEDIAFNWDSHKAKMDPGASIAMNLGEDIPMEKEITYIGDNSQKTYNGVGVKVALDPAGAKDRNYKYSFNLNLNGSSELNFIPLGDTTNVKVRSDWQTPSFDGAFLPSEREVNDKGFSANWKILNFNRNFPSSWKEGASLNFFEPKFGVKLMMPVDEYQKTSRSIKYSILLISLTFLIFFFVEVIEKRRIHPIQYTLVGLALLLFFTLLLAISEHLSFNLAYLIASLATIAMITLYSKTIFKNLKLTLLQAGILAMIYAFIFTIIQLQDYSLLMGSLGLFIILAVVMYISRKIDWYGGEESEKGD